MATRGGAWGSVTASERGRGSTLDEVQPMQSVGKIAAPLQMDSASFSSRGEGKKRGGESCVAAVNTEKVALLTKMLESRI